MPVEAHAHVHFAAKTAAARYLSQQFALSAEEIADLKRQGFVSQESRNNKSVIFKLRFRHQGRQRVRYLGTDPGQAQEIARVLAELQRLRRSELKLRALNQKATELLKNSKRRLEPFLKSAGLRFHGQAIRRARQ